MSKEARNLPEMEEFKKVIADVQKESNTQEVKEKIRSALDCLAKAQNEIYIQLENPSTELRYSHVNTKNEITRL